VDAAGMKGTGTWTVQDRARTWASRLSAIAEAVFARALPPPAPNCARRRSGRFAGSGRHGPEAWPTATPSSRTSGRRCGPPRSSPTAQGLESDQDRGARDYGWDIKTWPRWRASGAAGCIIRAQAAGSHRQRVRRGQPGDPSWTAPSIAAGLAESTPGLAPRGRHRRCTRASRSPGFSSALSYYDLVRAPRTNAALTCRGLRDFFGSHTYQRVDKEGTFHTLWSGDRTEVQE
jgi:6-phosphogluconate dehydrogenase